MVRRVLAAAAVTAFGLLACWAPPALAASPSITLNSPSNAAPLTDPVIRVVGQASMPSGGTVNGQLRIEVTSLEGHGGQQIAVNVNGNPVPFSWDYTTAHNGLYRVRVTAQGRDGALDQSPNETSFVTRDVAVEVRPAPPGNVNAKVDKSRQAVVTWAANPEPDILGYQVQRHRPDMAADAWEAAANVTTASFADSTTASAGGAYKYRVVAVRRAASPDQAMTSDPSSEQSVTVPNPPGTTTTTPGGSGGGGGAGGGGGTTGPGGSGGGAGGTDANGNPALASSGKVDLSGFAGLLNSSRRPTPGQPGAIEPDPGFSSELPFKPGEEVVGEDGTALGVGIHEVGAGEEERKPIMFVAASLLITVILMHLQWLKREVDRVPADELEATA
jgi:hypothetical protein